MMTLDNAFDLVLYAFQHGNPGDIFIQKSPSASLEILAKAISNIFKKPNHPIKVIGTRHGEKLYEALLSREEKVFAEDLGDYFRVPPDLRDLNYGKYIEEGELKISQSEDYNSENSPQLNVQEMEKLLMQLNFINLAVSGQPFNYEE